MPDKNQLAYELRIGVTGHRNLAADKIPLIEQAVTKLLAQIGHTLAGATRHPHGPHGSPRTGIQRCDSLLVKAVQSCGLMKCTPHPVPIDRQTPVNWVVVSPLAKGADRIVARDVLNGLPEQLLEQSTAPPRLEAIMPMPVDEYRKDFVSPDDLAEFNELLAQADQPCSLVILNADFAQQAQSDPQTARPNAYWDVGQEVVAACEILIAVWNGEAAAGRGGTGEIVRHAVQSGRMVLWIDSEEPTKPPQLLKLKPEIKNFTGSISDFLKKPVPTTAKELSPGFHRLSGYQRDPLHNCVCEDIHTWLAKRRKAAEADPVVAAAVAAIDDALFPHYVRTDALAGIYQKRYFRAIELVYGCSVVAVGVVAGQVLFFPHHTWLIAFEILVMIVAAALVRVSRSEEWKERWQHDRHLAEWLRRQHFTWLMHQSLSKMRERVIDPRPYPGAEEWFERAFRPLLARLRSQVPAPLELETLRCVIIEGWIGDQADWHALQPKKRTNQAHRAHWWGWLLFLATLLAAGLHMAGVGHGDSQDPHAAPGLLAKVITFLAIVLPTAGAAVHTCASMRDYERLAARSKQLTPVLRDLQNRVADAEDHDELARVVAEANHVMAQENDDWWVSLSGQAPLMPG